MTEEEKKLFEKIKYKSGYGIRTQASYDVIEEMEGTRAKEKAIEYQGEFNFLIYLIEKLQKENEELRHYYDIATTKTEELKKKLGLKQFDVNVVYNDYLEKLREFKSNSIPKDKIREKLNWYEDTCERLSKSGIELDMYDKYQGAIELCKELLEEEQ